MSIFSSLLVLLISFVAGADGVLDEFQFHQPLVACTLIGLVTGKLIPCVIIGGFLQLITLGWANLGAAISPDIALASVSAAIIYCKLRTVTTYRGLTIALAILISIVGSPLTKIIRTQAVGIMHRMEIAAQRGDLVKIDRLHCFVMVLQGLRVLIPALILLILPSRFLMDGARLLPEWLLLGFSVGAGLVVAVSFAVILNMIAAPELWPFFTIGFVLAAIPQLTLLALSLLGLGLVLIFLYLQNGSKTKRYGKSLDDVIDK